MAETITFSIVLKDLGSHPMAKFAKNMDRQVKSITRMTKVLENSFAGTQKRINGLSSSMGKLGAKKPLTNLNKGLNTASGQLDRVISKMNKLGNMRPTAPKIPTAPTAGVPGAKKGSGGGLGMMGGIMGAAGGLFALDQIFSFGKGIIDVTANFQKFEAVLTNTFGSADRAKASMQQIQDFAAKTPFSVDNLTGAYVKLANRGFVPTMKEMTSMGDLASSVGKDFDQLVEAMMDAEMGENERLKEFGIKGTDNRDGTMTYQFKGQSKTIKKDAASIREYILSLGQMKGVEGAMDGISKTLGGQISNMMDNLMNLQKVIGGQSGGIFALAISGINNLISFFTELVQKASPVQAAFGRIYKAVAPMAEAVYGAFNAVGLFNTGGSMAEQTINLISGALNFVTPIIKTFSGVITYAANFVKEFSSGFQVLTGALIGGFAAYKIIGMFNTLNTALKGGFIASKLMAAGTWAWNIAMSMSPIGWVITAVAGLTAGVLVAWNKFEGFRGTIMGIWEVLKGFGSALTTDFGGTLMNIGRGIANFFGKLIQPVFTMIEAIKSGEWMKAAKAGGELLLNVTGPGALMEAGKAVTNGLANSDAFKAGKAKAKNGGGTFGMPDFFNRVKAAGTVPVTPDMAGAPEAAAAAAVAASQAEKDAGVKSFGSGGATQGGVQMHISTLFSIQTQKLLDSMGKDGLAIREVLTKELLAIVNDVSISHG